MVAVAIQFIPVVGQIATAVGGAIGSAVGAVAGATIGGAVGSFAAGATLGAISSAGSQAFGLATGIQDKFSWKAVGTAALSGGIGGGSTGNFVNDAINGAINNAAVQGIAVVTGLQKKFDFAGVAAAGIGAGVGGQLRGFGDTVSSKVGAATNARIGAAAGQITVSAASAIANAATRSAIDGSNFGDNVVAAIPDVIGQAIGTQLGHSLAGALTKRVNEAGTGNQAISEVRTTGNRLNIGGAVTDAVINNFFGISLSDSSYSFYPEDVGPNNGDVIIVDGQRQKKPNFFGRVFNNGLKIGAAGLGLGIGLFKGVGESVYGLAKDTATLILNPIDTTKAVIGGIGSGISYVGDVFTGEANLKADITGLLNSGRGKIDKYLTSRINTVQAALNGNAGDAFRAGIRIGDDIGTAGVNIVATVGTGGVGYVGVKAGTKVVAKAVREADFADAARRFAADESGAVPLGKTKTFSIKGRLKAQNLPTNGKIRFVPRKGYNPQIPIERGPQNGFVDRFGNEWIKGPSRTPGQPFEWDVQLSRRGRESIGHLSRDGKHVNVSLDGRVTH